MAAASLHAQPKQKQSPPVPTAAFRARAELPAQGTATQATVARLALNVEPNTAEKTAPGVLAKT